MKNTTTRRRTVTSAPGSLLPHATILALSPAHLHAQAEAAVHDIYKQSESANTVRAYAAALRYWAGWFQLRYRQRLALPVPAPAVVQFIVDHVERHTDAGTLVHELPPAIDAALLAAGFKAKSGAPKLPSVEQR